MHKRVTDLHGMVEAANSEWQRIRTNQELYRDLRELRSRYRLTCNSMKGAIHWIDTKDREEQNRFEKDLIGLLVKHGVPERLWINVYYWAISDSPDECSFFGDVGFPSCRKRVLEDGQIKHELVITPTTLIRNPMVLQYIEHWQRQCLSDDPPPEPKPLKDNPRKLDWYPLVEWHKRHPTVSINEIAKILDYHPVTVRRKLIEFGK